MSLNLKKGLNLPTKHGAGGESAIGPWNKVKVSLRYIPVLLAFALK
jgi:hypothetical protein